MPETLTSVDSREKKFLSFTYVEVKDLAKHFLTLVSGALALTVTFSDKIVDFPRATNEQRGLVVWAWGLFIAALVLTGAAIFSNYIGASQALRGNEASLNRLSRLSYLALDAAGISFVVALALLVTCVVSKGNQESASKNQFRNIELTSNGVLISQTENRRREDPPVAATFASNGARGSALRVEEGGDPSTSEPVVVITRTDVLQGSVMVRYNELGELIADLQKIHQLRSQFE
jgi:hypothetical protein